MKNKKEVEKIDYTPLTPEQSADPKFWQSLLDKIPDQTNFLWLDGDNKLQKQNVGNAGEYYIAARLSALDFTVTLTLGRAEKYDILALSSKGKFLKLSVKTTQNNNATGFPLSEKDEKDASGDFYYAFVKLNGFHKEPDFWIIPSKIVCPILKKSHELYLKIPGKKNQTRMGSSLRMLPIVTTSSQKILYPENWDEDVKKYYKNLDQLV